MVNNKTDVQPQDKHEHDSQHAQHAQPQDKPNEQHASEDKKTKSEKPEPSFRRKRQLEQMARVKKAKEKPRVRVTPRDDEVRRLVKHPHAGAFRSSGSLEWPDDTFTRRRISEGVVTLEESREKSAAPAPAPASH